jgi:hypothetical protein
MLLARSSRNSVCTTKSCSLYGMYVAPLVQHFQENGTAHIQFAVCVSIAMDRDTARGAHFSTYRNADRDSGTRS